jgi:hypothetical protein
VSPKLSPVVRAPRQAPHELDGLLEVLDAGRRSWERRSDAAERPDGLVCEHPRIHVGRCGFMCCTIRRSRLRCWRSRCATSTSGRVVRVDHDSTLGTLLRGTRCR